MSPRSVFPSEEGMEESCVANRVPTICHANGAVWQMVRDGLRDDLPQHQIRNRWHRGIQQH